eukprot:contig_14201_g3399
MYRTPAGMDGGTWMSWCTAMAENVFSTLLPDEAKVLIIDGSRAHIGHEALDALARISVEVFFLPANSTHATQQLEVTVFQPFTRSAREELASGGKALNVSNNKAGTMGIFEAMSCLSRAYKKAFTSTLIRASFEATGVEPWNPAKLQNHITVSDSDKRTKEVKHSLTLLASRLAPAVASERNELKWERGTLRTTQAVFMDKDNRKWLAKHQNDREKKEKDKEDGKIKRAEATAKREEVANEKAAAREERTRKMKEKKAADTAALAARRAAAAMKQAEACAAKEEKRVAMDRKKEEALKRRKAAASAKTTVGKAAGSS